MLQEPQPGNDLTRTTDDAIKVSEKFLLGDLIKVCVDQMKKLPMGWGVLPEKQQKEVIDAMTYSVTEAVRQVVYLVASNDRPHILATLESVTFQDGVKLKLELNKLAANRHDLADAQGGTVMIVLPRVSDHLGGTPPKAQPDQPSLPV